ncbi:Polyprenyl synthetase, partial [human gut metagenome]
VEESLASSFNTGAEDFNALIRPLSAAGGKRLRAQLCLLIANAGTSIERQRIKIAEAVEMLHLATLIHKVCCFLLRLCHITLYALIDAIYIFHLHELTFYEACNNMREYLKILHIRHFRYDFKCF